MLERKNRSKNLTNHDIEIAVSILNGIEGKLTWDELITAIDFKTGQHYTRQALSKHSLIKKAYDIAKARIVAQRAKINNVDMTLLAKKCALEKKLKKLEEENQKLKKENEDLLLQLALLKA